MRKPRTREQKDATNKQRREKYQRDLRENPEAVKEFNRKRYQKYKARMDAYSNKWREENKDNPDFKAKRNARRLKHYYNNPLKEKARGAVNKAIRSGKLVKPKQCEDCELEKPLEGHHEDYNKPLEVNWICKSCHWKRHPYQKQTLQAISKLRV